MLSSHVTTWLLAGTIGIWGWGPGVAYPQSMKSGSKEMPAQKTLKTAPSCPEGTTKQIDKVGPEDRCHVRVNVDCLMGAETLAVDDDGHTDRCKPMRPGHTAVRCVLLGVGELPRGFTKTVQVGRDFCEYSKPPTCVSGKLVVKFGEDACD